MARKTITGLYERNGIWHIDKLVKGERIQESTGEGTREGAERYLIRLLENRRQETVYGVRKIRTFREAATKYLLEVKEEDQPSIHITATYLEQADPFIGDLPLTHVDNDSLKPFIKYMRTGGKLPSGKPKRPCKNRTVNIALQRIIRVLNVSHSEYRDDQKRPWLDAVPNIKLMDEEADKRQPYPLTWEEQRILFSLLSPHLERMALFKVNTGCREQEVCKLQWDWECYVDELETSVFIVPSNFGGRTGKKTSGVKNSEDRVIILNDVAKSVIESQRGLHKKYVFPYEGRALHRMNDTAWDTATKKAAAKFKELHGKPPHPLFATLRIHDLKHTFGRRLRAADVGIEDRQVLLGHKTGSVTTHYSGAELRGLINSANKVSTVNGNTPTLTILRRRAA